MSEGEERPTIIQNVIFVSWNTSLAMAFTMNVGLQEIFCPPHNTHTVTVTLHTHCEWVIDTESEATQS